VDINDKAPVQASAEIVVDAPVGIVWDVLSDIRNWSEWNPSVSTVSMYGEFAPQTEFHWKADGVMLKSQLQEIEPQQRLVWTGRSPGVRAIHVWEFEEQGERTRVVTRECFEGLLSRLMSGPLTRMLTTSLDKGLQSLKDESERRRQHAGD
jgi:hypothetical protein